MNKTVARLLKFAVITLLFCLFAVHLAGSMASAATQTGSVGLEGTISAAPPSVAPTISTPGNGQSFTTQTITVSGICASNDLLVKVFKNGVFGGSVQCSNGSFSLKMDLFSGKNDIIAKVYDNLDQASPDSKTITVTLNDTLGGTNVPQVLITSSFAKRGAAPRETLSWPFIVSGGTAPYAVSADWGDGNTSLTTVAAASVFTLEHIYQNAGIYRVIIKVADSNGLTSYLQVTAIGSGAIQTTPLPSATPLAGAATNCAPSILYWWYYLVFIILLPLCFWLGKRYENHRLTRTN